MANVSIISQAHVSELSLHNPRHSTTKYSWVYVLLSENRHIFFKTDHLGFYALQWSVSLRCTVSQARTRRLILMEQRVGRERGGFLEAALVPPPPGLPPQVAWCWTARRGSLFRVRPAKAMVSSALLGRGPACHLFLHRSRSDQYRAQITVWSKRTPGNKAILCQSVLFSCTVFPTFSVIAGSHCQGY